MLKTESYKKGVVLSTGLNILAKGITFGNTLILSYFFGTSASTDVYFYILSVTVLITGMINGIDYYVLIPEAMKIKELQGQKPHQQFLNFFIYLYLFIAFIFMVLGLLMPIAFYTFFSKYDSGTLNGNISLLYIGSIIILFQLINNFLGAILTSYKYFTVTILSGLVNSVFSISFTLFFHSQLGIKGTMLGIAIGYFINFCILLSILKKYQNWNFLNVKWVKEKRVWWNIFLMQVNILPVWIRNYLTIFFLTGMGVGVITSLNLAQMLASLPEIFILTQITSIVGIKFSELAATKNYAETNLLLQNVCKTLFLIILPIAIVMIVLNKEIIQLAFERGNFNSNSIVTTAFCFTFFAILLPSKIFDVLLSRLFTSFQLYGVSTFFGVIAHTIITASLYFLTNKYQLQGYFYALILGYYIIMPIAFLLIVHYKMKSIEIAKLFLDTASLIAIATLVYFLINALLPYLPSIIIIKIILVTLVTFLLFFLLSKTLIDCTYQMNLIGTIFKKYTKK